MPLEQNTSQRVPAGFEGLVEHHLDGLYRFALSLTRQPNEAADLLQEALLKAWKAFENFESGGNFKAWIFTILMNCFRDRYRRQKRQAQREVPLADLPEPASVAQDVFDLLLKEEVLSAVNALPEPFRLAVHLVDLEGFPYREAATALDCPLGTLMSRLNRGRALLRLSLAGLARDRGWLAADAGAKGVPHDLR